MATQNSINSTFANNADGFSHSGGVTPRVLTVTGADMTLTGSGANTYTFPSSTDTLAGHLDKLSVFAATTSAELAGVISDETGTGLLMFNNSPTIVDDLTIGTAGTSTGSLLMKGTTSGTITITTADEAGTYTLTLPTSDGDASQVLQTDGSGVLSWATVSAGTPTAITVANEATDTSCYPLFVTAATGDLGPKTNAGLSFNSETAVLTATGFSGPLTGNVTGDVSGSSGSCTGQAATVANATFTTALTVNTGTVTLTGNVTNNSVLTIGAGAVSVAGDNTGDNTVCTSGTATTAVTLATTRAIYGNNFDGSAALTQVIGSAYGGTGNGFTKFTGATTAEKTYTLPDANATILYSGGALGTPASGTVTNLTGTASININGTVGATTPTTIKATTIETSSTIELGHASDTTIARVSAGVISVENVTIPTISSTSTLTNKRITQRVVTATDDATAVIDVDACDQYQLTAIANNTEFSVTGTPTNGQKLIIRYVDAGTTKNLTYAADTFRVIGVTLPTATVANKTGYIGCVYNSAASRWDVLAVGLEA